MLITKGTYPEHSLINWSKIDPPNISKNIHSWLEDQNWFSPKLIQGIWTHGITIAGMGVLNLRWLSNVFESAIVSITDEPPDNQSIKKILLTKIEYGEEKWKIIQNSIPPRSIRQIMPNCNLWLAIYNISFKEAIRQLRLHQINSCLPEGLRLARLIASNIQYPLEL